MDNCKDCPLNASNKVGYEIREGASVLFIGEAPAQEEVKQRKPFVGRSGALLEKMLFLIGLRRDDVSIANALMCQIPPNTPESVIRNALKCCHENVLRGIQQANPKLIVCLGDKALKQVLGKSAGSISKARGNIISLNGYNVLPTFHPAYILRKCHANYPNINRDEMYASELLFLNDFMKIAEILNGNIRQSKLDTDKYKEIYDHEIEPLLGLSKIIFFDLEWDGDKLLCVSMANGSDYVYVYMVENNTIPESLKAIFENPNIHKVVANRPVDELWLEKVGCKVNGVVHDIFLMAHLIDENIDVMSLEMLAQSFLGTERIKEYAKGKRFNLSSLPKDDLLVYSAVDTDVTSQLYQVFKKQLLSHEKLLTYYAYFLRPVSDLLPILKSYGCKIDIKKLKENQAKLEERLNEIEKEALDLIPDKIKIKYSDNLSLTRTNIITDYLFLDKAGVRRKPVITTNKNKAPATSEKHLKMFMDVPFVQKLFEFKKLKKLISTYLDPMMDYIYSDGRVHPDTFLYRTVTGRTAMTNPPIQQIPQRGSEYIDYVREIFVADEGYKMVSLDLSQSELRIMAWLANETNMLNAFMQGIDIHALTASLVSKKPLDQITKIDRHHAKAINFGFIYGMSAKSFMQYAKDTYDVSYTLEEAEEIRDKYFKVYPAVARYHDQIKAFLKKYGYVESPLGRRRRLLKIYSDDISERADAERKAINFPIQSFSSDLGLLGMKLFYDAYMSNPRLKDKVKLLWFIHDAIFFQAEEDVVDEAIALAKECLTKRTSEYIRKYFGFVVGYPIEAEAKVGDNWANLKEVK